MPKPLRLCFSVKGVGLANNGGSRTLIRCVETLRAMGHDAFFHSGASRYTWHKPDIRLVGGDKHPSCDVTIATGYNSFKAVARYSRGLRCGYARGLELWKANEARLLEAFDSVDHMFVNSEWLLHYMQDHSISATLQYPGLDLEWFNLTDGLRAGVGALLNNRHKTKRNNDVEAMEKEYGLPMRYLNRDIKRPDSPTLNKWYNGLKVWFAPSELEGLHNPPIEASLAGCAVVATDHPRSGMSDYLVHGETALVYPARDLKKADAAVRLLLDDEDLRRRLNFNMIKLLVCKIGDRPTQMTEMMSRFRQLSGLKVSDSV